MIEIDSIVEIAKSQVSCDLNGEAVMLNLQDGTYYGLNPVGAEIWQLMREPITVRAIVSTLLQTYEVAPEQCEREVLALLQQLASRGLVEVKVGAHP